MGNVSVPHFGVHLSRKDFDALKQRLKDSGTKYYDEPYLRFKGTKYEQETFFVKDPNENILEIKTLTSKSRIVLYNYSNLSCNNYISIFFDSLLNSR